MNSEYLFLGWMFHSVCCVVWSLDSKISPKKILRMHLDPRKLHRVCGCGQIHEGREGEGEGVGEGEEKRRRRRELAAAAVLHLRLPLLCSSSPAARISRQSAPAPARPHQQLLHIRPCSPFSLDRPDLQSSAIRTCSPASIARPPGTFPASSVPRHSVLL